MSLLLYGVVPTGQPVPRGSGDQDRPSIMVVEEGDLTVVAGELPDDDIEVSETYAINHLDVLTELIRHGPVLPLRFATVAPDAATVRSEVIGPAAEQLRRALDRVRDQVELRMDLTFAEDAVIRKAYETDPEMRHRTAGQPASAADLQSQIELGQYIAERVADLRQVTLGVWVDRLKPLAEAVSVLDPPEEGTERIALLAGRDRIEVIDQAVLVLREESSPEVADVEYVGPLPVFTFATDADEPEPETAASRWGW